MVGAAKLTGAIARRFPEANVFCYEPSPYIFEEARENLADLENVVLVSELGRIKGGNEFEYVFCLEVFEHLPRRQAADTLKKIKHLLKDGGTFFVGVPNELFVPALVKGLFRMARRYGAFDARFGNVLRAAIGRPPERRPVKEIASGLPYHFHHLGFDHRRLRTLLSDNLDLVRQFGSPTSVNLFDSEIYFILKKTVKTPRPSAHQIVLAKVDRASRGLGLRALGTRDRCTSLAGRVGRIFGGKEKHFCGASRWPAPCCDCSRP